MKINKIVIENLASLKGRHEINFEEIEKQSSLFAITGETGAGKSTILNAISLAIFGKNYKRSINQNDLITLGASEGKAETTFELRDRVYQSSWFCRVKKKNGEDLKNVKPVRELYEILPNGEKSLLEVSEEEILGLNFDQFCKTVILNQGEFSKFLLATFSERKEILERFYNAEALARLSKLAKQELDETSIQIKENQNKIEGIFSGQTEDPKVLQEKITSESKLLDEKYFHKKEQEELLKEISEIVLHIKTKKQNEERLKNTILKLKEITEAHNHYLVKFTSIKERYLNLKTENEKEIPKLQKAIALDKEIHFYLREKENELINQKKIIENIHKTESHILENLKTIDELKRNQNEFFFEKDLSLEIVSTDLANTRILKSLNESNDHLIIQSEHFQKQLHEYEEEGKKQNQELSVISNFLNSNKDLILIENELTTLAKAFEESIDYEKQLNRLQSLLKQNETKSNDLSSKREEVKKKTETLSNDLILLGKKLELINNSLELFELKRSIHLCASQSLKEGVCVVCHSPITEEDLPKESESSDKENEFFNEKEVILTELSNREKTLHKSQIEEELYQKQITDLKESNLNEEKEFQERFKNFTSLNKNKETLKKEQDELQNLKSKIQSSKQDKLRLDENIFKLRERYKKLKEEKVSIDNKVEKNQLLIKSTQEKITTSIKGDLTSTEKLLEEELKRLQKLAEINLIHDGHSKRLSEYKESESSSKEKKLKLEDELNRLNTERNALNILNEPKEQLEKLLLGFKESEKEYEESQANLKKIEIELKENEANKRQTSDQINDISIELGLRFSRLNEKIKNQNSNETHHPLLEDVTKKVILKTEGELPDIIVLEATTQRLQTLGDEIQEEINELQKSIAKNQTLLSEYKKASQRKELIELEIERLQEILKRRELIFSLVGRDEFRNFVLSQIEKELIYQTNKELKRLCDGRYEIIQENKASRILPEFFIIDKLRDGGIRKVSTLSGGETFMVSLACALALAELSRGTAEIDSFFIDEGFGTLDEDSLEDVIDMLQSIQGLGKQIGIISHVKKLTERIPVNIHLDKNHFGDSTISLHFN